MDNEMDIDETCEFFADSKMIAGNVAPVATICNGSKTDIEREVKKCILAEYISKLFKFIVHMFKTYRR